MAKLWMAVFFLPILVALLSVFIQADQNDNVQSGVHWAVIVAGSNGWFNYRHQADACHAYQIMIKNGIPPERIITLMYDDVADNTENPTPGIIINHLEGSDVYHGVKIDYRLQDVTPEIFLAVLTGNKSAVAGAGTGRVLESGKNDHVFVNFVDHGAPGLIGFPSSTLKASDLMNAILYMHEHNMFNEMVLYIEACESGSMFKHLLPTNISVYATTAANPKESSYACYYDKERKTYLGDVYSVMWMEDSDKEDLSKETLHQQFKIVQKETNTSHVRQYGDKTIADQKVADFQAGAQYKFKPIVLPEIELDAVPSEDVELEILSHRLADANTEEEKYLLAVRIQSHIEERQSIRRLFQQITDMIAGSDPKLQEQLAQRPELTNFECYEEAVDSLQEHCFKLNQAPYAFQQLYQLVSLCESGVPLPHIQWSIKKTCQPGSPLL